LKRITLILTILILLTQACSLPGDDATQSDEVSPPQSEHRCGDGVCDGPENADNCPGDCISVAAGQPNADPDADDKGSQEISSPDISGSGNRYVSFSGSISTAQNTAAMGDFTGTAFEYSSDYSVELWFPMEGGDAVQQRNTITLTEFKDLYFGDQTCVPCEWTLDESAFEPVSFTLNASLNLNAIEENDQPADELVYQIVEIPHAVITGIVGCPCGLPDNFSDPAAFPQMLGWFRQKLVNPIYLNAIETSSAENFAVSPTGFLNIPKETLSYVIVPDLETP